jgi:hypothetical protein
MDPALDSIGLDAADMCMVQGILASRAAAEEELQRARAQPSTPSQRRADMVTANADAYVDELPN